MTLRRAFAFICILSLISFKQLLAQPARHPMVYYKPADYKGGLHNYAFVQGKRGLIYVGNEEMVLEYDGLSWKNIPVKSGVNVYSLAVDTLNRVFVGGNNEFGFLSPDNSGKLKYKSLFFIGMVIISKFIRHLILFEKHFLSIIAYMLLLNPLV
jgi:hypothetical protein